MIKLDGTAPKMKIINMAAEPNCAKEHTTPAMTEDVVPGDGGTLQNVVVYLKGDFSQYSFPRQSTPQEIDQKGCQYHPHVLALHDRPALAGGQFRPDHAQHSPRSQEQSRVERIAAARSAAPIMQSFARQEVAIPVKCNVHPWMKAYIAVFDNPYFRLPAKMAPSPSRTCLRELTPSPPGMRAYGIHGPERHRRPQRVQDGYDHLQGQCRLGGLIYAPKGGVEPRPAAASLLLTLP